MSELSDLLAACDALAADTHAAKTTRAMAQRLRAWAPTVAAPAPSPTPTPTPTPTPGTILPRQGFSNSAQPSASDDRTLDACADLANGHPWWLRFDWWPDAISNARFIAVAASVTARGGTPMGLYNTPYSGRPTVTTYAANCGTLAKLCNLVNTFNEPDMNGWPAADAADQSIASYAAVHAANPRALVIGPSIWKTTADTPEAAQAYVATMVARAAGRPMWDVFDIHLYGDPRDIGPWNLWAKVFTDAPTVKSLLKPGTPIICTEAGDNAQADGETAQLNAVGGGMDARATLGLAGYGVYAVTNDSTPGGYGLKHSDWTNRPAYAAFKQRAL